MSLWPLSALTYLRPSFKLCVFCRDDSFSLWHSVSVLTNRPAGLNQSNILSKQITRTKPCWSSVKRLQKILILSLETCYCQFYFRFTVTVHGNCLSAFTLQPWSGSLGVYIYLRPILFVESNVIGSSQRDRCFPWISGMWVNWKRWVTLYNKVPKNVSCDLSRSEEWVR